jgi:hypothetical protein
VSVVRLAAAANRLEDVPVLVVYPTISHTSIPLNKADLEKIENCRVPTSTCDLKERKL